MKMPELNELYYFAQVVYFAQLVEHGGRRRLFQAGFAGLGNPATQEQALHLPHHRPLAAQQHVDPRCVAGFNLKRRIGAVLTAAVSKAVVDHGEFAMVAQVDAAEDEVPHEGNVVQRGQQFHAGLASCARAAPCEKRANQARPPSLGIAPRAAAATVCAMRWPVSSFSQM